MQCEHKTTLEKYANKSLQGSNEIEPRPPLLGDLSSTLLFPIRVRLLCSHVLKQTETPPSFGTRSSIDPGVNVSQSKLQHLKVTTDGSDRDFKADVRFIDGQGVLPSSYFGGFEPHAVNTHVNLQRSR